MQCRGEEAGVTGLILTTTTPRRTKVGKKVAIVGMAELCRVRPGVCNCKEKAGGQQWLGQGGEEYDNAWLGLI